jgi:hypothetical protein
MEVIKIEPCSDINLEGMSTVGDVINVKHEDHVSVMKYENEVRFF